MDVGMEELVMRVDAPNENEFADDGAVLRVWHEAHERLSTQRATFVVGKEATSWYGVTVDARAVLRFLEAELGRHASGSPTVRPPGLSEDLALRLHIEPSGTAETAAGFPADRFLEQLFVACNLAQAGSCAFTRGDAPIRLDPMLIESAYHLGRTPDDESMETDFWPDLQPVTFTQAWEWLQEDLSYDTDVARTPAQMTVFSLLLLATRIPEDSDNILVIARAIEAIFGRGVRENISRTIEERIESRFGRSRGYPRWFRQFYDLRSRLVHGDNVLPRPGVGSFSSPEGFAFHDEHFGPVMHGMRLLLASLYEMIRLNRRDLDL
jgi:hypothetical protein